MLRTSSSPHLHSKRKTGALMLEVVLATVPAIAVMTWFYGWGTLINLVWMIFLALVMEASVMKLRGRPVGFYLGDFSALVTAVLLALAIPAYAPWWIGLIGIFFAIVVAKHLYGGMGFNPFNPAMVGYVILLISYPLEMTQWPTPRSDIDTQAPGMLESLQYIFVGNTPTDGLTSATALDVFKQNQELMVHQLYEQSPAFSAGSFAGLGAEWINLAFLAGGIWLLYRRIYSWHGPTAMLITITLMASFGYDGGSSASLGSPLFHLLSGATMLGAFFIITDPVSGCTSNRGRFIFGAGVGLLVYLIRSWGNYPDAIAFAVLLMNFAAPFIDYYTQPRTYGHSRSSHVRINKD